MTMDVPVKTVSGTYLEEAVDAEVARIVREKQSVSGAFEDTDVVRDGASEDVDDGERVDM
jgi:hypothetical protein